MKKILVIVAGLVLSSGLYAQSAKSNCKKVDNFWATIDANRYVLNGNLCTAKGTSPDTFQQYVVDHANGKYGTVTNKSLTSNGKTVVVNGFLKVDKVGQVAPGTAIQGGQTLSEFLTDIWDQLINGKAETTSQFLPIDNK